MFKRNRIAWLPLPGCLLLLLLAGCAGGETSTDGDTQAAPAAEAASLASANAPEDASSTGNWTNADGSKSMPFRLSAGSPNGEGPVEASTAEQWAGEWNWEANNQFDDQTLTITKADAGSRSFDFILDTRSGGHIGSIEGTAKLSKDGSSATYTAEDIEIEMQLDQGVLSAEIIGDATSYGGMGVSFGGKFVRQDTKKVLDLLELGVFEKKEQDEWFRQLVGDDYELFASSFQLFEPIQDENDPSITVVKGGVRGLFTYMKAIIMYKEDGTMWAAVINGDENLVDYYTTVKDDYMKMPAAIETWYSRLDLPSIVYVSASEAP